MTSKFIPKLPSVLRVAKPNQVNQSLIFWALIIVLLSQVYFIDFYTEIENRDKEWR